MVEEVGVYNLEGVLVRRVSIPEVFKTPVRPDLIKRAVVVLQSHRFQPQGRDPMAGKRTTAVSLGPGYGLARVPRVKGERFPKALAGAFAPSTRGGRRAHPPTTEKKIRKNMPKKERRKALKSAIAATAIRELVVARGHNIQEVKEIPLVVTDDIQKIKTAKEAKEAFIKLGIWPDIERAKERTRIRAGRGKMRGRRLKRAKGPLIVISEDEGISRAVSNFPGVDVSKVESLNIELLAPGTHPGRFVVWSESAFNKLQTLFKA